MRCANIPFLALTIAALGFGCDSGTTDDTSGNGGTDGGSADGGSGDGGEDVVAVWTSSRIETSASLSGVYSSGSAVYVVADEGRAWTRNGSSWNAELIDASGADLNCLWGSGQGEALSMVAAGDEGTICNWIGGGWICEDVGTANFEAAHGPAADNMMAVGWGGIYLNQSGDWEYQNEGSSYRFNHVWYNGASAFVVGEEGVIGTWTSGLEWTFEQTVERRPLYGVWAVSSTEAYAVGERGTVLKFDGSTWTQQDLGTDATFWAVWAASSSAIYVVGNNGKAYKGSTTETETTWTELPTGVENNLYAVHGSSATDVWAVGNRGAAMHYQEE